MCDFCVLFFCRGAAGSSTGGMPLVRKEGPPALVRDISCPPNLDTDGEAGIGLARQVSGPVMGIDEKARRRAALMGGGKLSATVSTMQTTENSKMNGENQTMQMMRQALRRSMVANASSKKLEVGADEGVGSAQPPAPKADPRAAFKARGHSASMPAHVMRKEVHMLGPTPPGSIKCLVEGFTELSEEQSLSAMRYIQFTCEKLGLNAADLPCAQRVIQVEEQVKHTTYNIIEDEEELSLDDMLKDGS